MFTIGIAGGSGSGKTTLVNAILKRIPVESIALLAQDAYYKDASHLPLEQRRALNFDHPDSIEWDLMLSDIRKLKSGQAIECPTYSYITCTRLPETIHIEPKKILLIEGILILTQPQICEEMDMRLYLEVEPDNRLSRIIERDMENRGRTAKQVIERYYKTVRPMHEEFIKPSRERADMLVMGGGLNAGAADFISSAILGKLTEQTL
ncbi:MAG TPA: uridine kinase [Dysgonamonadaceae bacterium]|jgi:uridine kinase|uniref:uridine kinase n=1 Tax=Seramator thermalis TaxID=2496270 RepID=UPI0009D2F238|nr:uridine kinase [Seramator thermalis]OPZ11771.1 MAG: Uridine kinase [Bacteroidetes bacterium ADurb.BinA261]HOM63054.1 uridine kinase [Dysgonamonadaceae bacterium]HPD43195.1 uridine kinase [Dysgonamonadaceae bacterium]HRS40517.1 uridine kinase [Dysgonamonadaceae bacterium]HRU12940.1 uridine kinase [Dysgonamonadaceae bacterium]